MVSLLTFIVTTKQGRHFCQNLEKKKRNETKQKESELRKTKKAKHKRSYFLKLGI